MMQMAETTVQVLMAVAFIMTPGIVFWLAVTGIALAVKRVKDLLARPAGKAEEKLALA